MTLLNVYFLLVVYIVKNWSMKNHRKMNKIDLSRQRRRNESHFLVDYLLTILLFCICCCKECASNFYLKPNKTQSTWIFFVITLLPFALQLHILRANSIYQLLQSATKLWLKLKRRQAGCDNSYIFLHGVMTGLCFRKQ